MPQASDALREAWGGECGVGEDKALAHLQGRGFKLTRQFDWVLPHPGYQPDADDWGAIDFLVYEWDYGGLAPLEGEVRLEEFKEQGKWWEIRFRRGELECVGEIKQRSDGAFEWFAACAFVADEGTAKTFQDAVSAIRGFQEG